MRNNYSLKQLIFYFVKLGTIGFGGSIALTNSMENDLVEDKKWLTREEFLLGLTLSQLAPGPLAAQLAMYIGYIRHKILGATCAGLVFILPSFLMVILISILYVQYGSLPIIQSLLYGIEASIIGIIASSAYDLTKRTVKGGVVNWIIFILILGVTLYTRSTNIFLFIGSGLFMILYNSRHKLQFFQSFVIIPVVNFHQTFTSSTLLNLFLFFISAGSLAFGGGFAIIPYLQNGVVNQYHWLTYTQFIDAIAVAMITPGPVVIAATFIGYLTAQLPGAIIATGAIFIPVYIIIICITPVFKRFAKNAYMISFIQGVTAAAMASLTASVVILGQESIKDIYALIIALIALFAVRFFKISGIVIILVSGIIGLLLK
jgi:chromate transporter